MKPSCASWLHGEASDLENRDDAAIPSTRPRDPRLSWRQDRPQCAGGVLELSCGAVVAHGGPDPRAHRRPARLGLVARAGPAALAGLRAAGVGSGRRAVSRRPRGVRRVCGFGRSARVHAGKTLSRPDCRRAHPCRSDRHAQAARGLAGERRELLQGRHPNRAPRPGSDAAEARVLVTRLSRWLPLIVAAASVLVRLPFLVQSEAFFNSDEALEGLMARHIRELPIFFWGQGYKGVPEVYLSATAFAIFGAGVVQLKAVTMAIWCGAVAVSTRLG